MKRSVGSEYRVIIQLSEEERIARGGENEHGRMQANPARRFNELPFNYTGSTLAAPR